MPSGYSKRSLIEKLGIAPGDRVHFARAPTNYARALGPLPPQARLVRTLAGQLDFIHAFFDVHAQLITRLPGLKLHLAQDGMLWISWPKKTSGVKTDLTQTHVRAAGLAAGLVDVKVAAIDEKWSGLKFVYRLRDRQA